MAKRAGTDQEELPGMAQPKIAAIERAAKKYHATIRTRLEIQQHEKTEKAKLMELMHEHITAPVIVDNTPTLIYKRADLEIIMPMKKTENVKVLLGDEVSDEVPEGGEGGDADPE